ncbi:hypothetical protein FHS29_006180 [Saccharothrix tamanrassetensis]|uniref:Uncharacterized protein n=1 Tax=Saccharothrix tamanrassetensis TaxID=1051531 RepID=A0A841CQJ1_9PSEU|nr:hypothetical protein [Saccharothrix tamanrassetensis]
MDWRRRPALSTQFLLSGDVLAVDMFAVDVFTASMFTVETATSATTASVRLSAQSFLMGKRDSLDSTISVELESSRSGAIFANRCP